MLGEHKHRERHRAEGAGGLVPKGQEEPGRPLLLDEPTGTGGSARPSSPRTRPSAGHLLSSLFAPHGTSRHGRVPSVPPPEGRLPYDLSFCRKARLSPSSGRGPWTPSSGSPPRTWPAPWWQRCPFCAPRGCHAVFLALRFFRHLCSEFPALQPFGLKWRVSAFLIGSQVTASAQLPRGLKAEQRGQGSWPFLASCPQTATQAGTGLLSGAGSAQGIH